MDPIHLIEMNEGMMVSGIILALSFIGIFTETLHGFSRVKVAMLGALTMLVVGQSYGFYNPEQAFEAVDWNVVFLLAAMMSIVAIMIKTGGFEVLATKIGANCKRQTISDAGNAWDSRYGHFTSLRQRDDGCDLWAFNCANLSKNESQCHTIFNGSCIVV